MWFMLMNRGLMVAGQGEVDATRQAQALAAG
jgi:hypothetical protein